MWRDAHAFLAISEITPQTSFRGANITPNMRSLLSDTVSHQRHHGMMRQFEAVGFSGLFALSRHVLSSRYRSGVLLERKYIQSHAHNVVISQILHKTQLYQFIFALSHLKHLADIVQHSIPRLARYIMSPTAARAAQKVAERGPRSYLPWLGIFLGVVFRFGFVLKLIVSSSLGNVHLLHCSQRRERHRQSPQSLPESQRSKRHAHLPRSRHST